MLLLAILYLIEHIFQPRKTRSFLILQSYSESSGFLFALFGLFVAGLFLLLVWWVSNVRYRAGAVHSNRQKFGLVLAVALSPFFGFFLGVDLMFPSSAVLLHQFSAKQQAVVPFSITGLEFDRYCRGVTASNPDFASDKLCEFERPGHVTDWLGRTVLVSGNLSQYGLMPVEYNLVES